MASAEHFLVFDGDKFSSYGEAAKPVFFDKLIASKSGRKFVYQHDIYQKIGKAVKSSRFEQLMARIKRVVCCVRYGGAADSSFVSLKEALCSLFKPFDSSVYKIYRRVQRPLKEIAAEYQKAHANSLLPHVLIPQPFIREGLTLSMKGIELLAARLSSKSNLSNLVVCHDLPDLRTKVKAIADDPADARFAFVVPCHQWEVSPFAHHAVEQHMLSVLVEKKQGKLHVCVLEPFVAERMNMDTVKALNVNSSNRQAIRFLPDELVMAYINDAGLGHWRTTTLYHTLVRRQFGPNGGCSTFALRDAVNFLKNKQFFDEIQVHKFAESLPNGVVKAITALPPAFMLSMQSVEKIAKYIESQPDFARQKLGKRGLTLQEAVARRTYRELTASASKTPKMLNKYIDERTAKYQEILLETLKPTEITEGVS